MRQATQLTGDMHQQRSDNSEPRFTIVLPVLNEAAYIDETLKSICDQDAPSASYEVLIYDGGSTDDTVDRVNSWSRRAKRISIAENNGRLPAAGRNRGIQDARGDVIAFVEGHCILPPNFVRRSLELIGETGAHALGRPLNLLVPSDPPIQQAIAIARHSWLGHARSSVLYSNFEGYCSPLSCATVYRREVFDQLGEFDERLLVGEDVEFNQRFAEAGLRHYFSSELRCGYHPRRTYRAILKQMFNYGLGRTRATRGRESISVTDFAPLGVICCVAIATVMAVLTGWLWLFLPAAIYVFACATSAAVSSFERGKLYLTGLVLMAVFLIHLGLASGQLWGLAEWLLPKTKQLTVS